MFGGSFKLDTKSGKKLKSPQNKKKEILIIDDEKKVLDGLISIVKNFGFDGKGVLSFKEAKEYLEINQPHLVITDILLKDGNGLDLLEWCQEKFPSLPIILITGKPDLKHISDAVRFNACDYIQKPISPSSLLAAIHRALTKRKLLENIIHLTEMNEILCQVLAKAVEAKDLFTAGHSQRVAEYAERIALKLGVSKEEAHQLRIAGQLHDIGKIGIEDKLLTAPRPLTNEEKNIIKKHPETAVKILEPLPKMENIRKWILEHHERWDGKGYPYGKKGKEISIQGRILIIVEVFDALHTARSYKPPWKIDKILEYYKDQRSRHFDPDLCDFFVEGLKKQGLGFLKPPQQKGLFT